MTEGKKVLIYRDGELLILETRDELGVFAPGTEIEVTIEGERYEEEDEDEEYGTLIHSTLGGRVSADGGQVFVERGWDHDAMGTPGTIPVSSVNVVGWLLKPVA